MILCLAVVTPLKLTLLSARSLLPSSLYLDHSHCPVLAPATLAALPSTRAIPDRDVFYVADPVRLHSIPIETCSLPALTHVLPPIRPVGFPIYVARCPAAPFARSYPRHFTLITRTARPRASYPSCVAVYPRD